VYRTEGRGLSENRKGGVRKILEGVVKRNYQRALRQRFATQAPVRTGSMGHNTPSSIGNRLHLGSQDYWREGSRSALWRDRLVHQDRAVSAGILASVIISSILHDV